MANRSTWIKTSCGTRRIMWEWLDFVERKRSQGIVYDYRTGPR